MYATPLLHKPISYGSHLADTAFYTLVGLHGLLAAGLVLALVGALLARKGSPIHLTCGRYFVYLMAGVCLSGIVIDVIRLLFMVVENHTKYPDYGMPSTYPARFAFLYGALCILYLLRQPLPRGIEIGGVTRAGSSGFIAWLLGALGILLGALIVGYYNPWTGALWMIGTFASMMVVLALPSGERTVGRLREREVTRHRIIMLFLAAFSGWGALQGFGPALDVAVNGVDNSSAHYAGDLPGSYTPSFWLFLIAWAPSFLLAGLAAIMFASRKKARFSRLD